MCSTYRLRNSMMRLFAIYRPVDLHRPSTFRKHCLQSSQKSCLQTANRTAEEIKVLINTLPQLAGLQLLHIPGTPSVSSMEKGCFLTSGPDCKSARQSHCVFLILAIAFREDCALVLAMLEHWTHHHRSALDQRQAPSRSHCK